MKTIKKISGSIKVSICIAIPFMLLLVFSCQPTNDQLPSPSGLMVELLTQPDNAAITDKKPQFSWIVENEDKETMQSAYQIQVATDSQKMVNNNGDIWNSGKVNS
ncbi:MAG: hypothetical protein ACQER7_15045, partial [Bacteroidota bacterium]